MHKFIKRIEMNNIWIKIRENLIHILPEIAKSLNKPATQKEIEQFEMIIEQKLPTSFIKYLTTFNGQNHNNFEITFIGGNSLLTIQEILDLWIMQVELFEDEPKIEITENRVRAKIWDKNWIPFSGFMGQPRLAIDLNPPKNGTYGQVLQLWAGKNLEDDDVVVANSFEEFSKHILKDLKLKNFQISDENLIKLNDDWII